GRGGDGYSSDESDEQRQPEPRTPAPAQLGMESHRDGAHSVFSTPAGNARAAARPDSAAMALPSTSARGTARRTGTGGTTGSGTTPIWFANKLQDQRPAATPAGMPTTSVTARREVACHATALRICPREKPSVLRIAKSRRRRRTTVTRVWVNVAIAITPRSAASTSGKLLTRFKLPTSPSETPAVTARSENFAFRRPCAARVSIPWTKRKRKTSS